MALAELTGTVKFGSGIEDLIEDSSLVDSPQYTSSFLMMWWNKKP